MSQQAAKWLVAGGRTQFDDRNLEILSPSESESVHTY